MTGKTHTLRALFLVALGVLVFASVRMRPALAQEAGENTDTSVIQRKLEWVVSDMGRLIEEMRRISRREDRSHLVEDIEDILYRDVEFPLVYQTQARKVVAQGLDSPQDILPGGFARKAESPALAELFAKAYALAGLARSYEGFPAAAQDYLLTARKYAPQVEDLPVQIDTFGPQRPIRFWLAEARETVSEEPIRVTFVGKAVSQQVADRLYRENIRFESLRTDMNYVLSVAARDFSKGVRRRLVTDDPITRNRAGWFRLYLPPGPYRIVTGDAPEHVSHIAVGTHPEQNRFLVETAGDGVTIFSIPVLETYTPGSNQGAIPLDSESSPQGQENAGGKDATK